MTLLLYECDQPNKNTVFMSRGLSSGYLDETAAVARRCSVKSAFQVSFEKIHRKTPA